MPRFDFYERVRVVDPADEHVGQLGAVTGIAVGDDGLGRYSVAIDEDEDGSVGYHERALVSVGEFAHRSDFYDGSSIRVSIDGELLTDDIESSPDHLEASPEHPRAHQRVALALVMGYAFMFVGFSGWWLIIGGAVASALMYPLTRSIRLRQFGMRPRRRYSTPETAGTEHDDHRTVV